MLTSVFRAVCGVFVVAGVLVLGAGTVSAATDKKETTKKTWAVDPSHGSYSDAIPIQVPAFHGITPKLALSYDSSDGNGELGVGWRLDGVSVIERASPGKGAPRYDGTDIFLLDGEELVACASGSESPSCTTGGTHSTKVESYERIAIGSDGRWTITGKDGTRRVYAPIFTTDAGVYEWGLEQVIDTMDNVVTYRWGVDALGCCWEHLDAIEYNGTTIAFHYEARPDVELAAIGSGAMRSMQGRIATIDVAVSGDRLRAYALDYTKSDATSRSLLASVRQFGRDARIDGDGAVTGGTSLPPITIEYQGGEPAFAEGSHDLRMANTADSHSFAIDIDGDGMTDMLELYPLLGVMRHRTWISDGEGFTETSDDFGMSANTNSRFVPMDVDGDGKTDVVEIYPSVLSWGMRTWISDGTGFDETSNDILAALYDTNSHFLPMDINGDGMSDLLELRPTMFSYRRVSWISNGEGFTQVSDEAGIAYDTNSRFFAMDVDGDGKTDLVELFPGIGAWSRHIWLSYGTGFSSGATDYIEHSADDEFIPMDINGDGKTDLLQIHPFASVNHLNAWLSTGDAFTLGSNDLGAPFSADNWYVAIDVNGDGKSDLVELDPYGLGVYRRQIWLSVGAGFVAGAQDLELGFNSDTRVMAADVDGDGLSEMIEVYPATVVSGRRVWSMTGGAVPDLLASLTNSLGGTTSVGYTPSSAWENTNNPPLMQTATEVTASDGRGGSSTTTYEYAGGLHDRFEKRFLGFRYQLETLPCIEGEEKCPYVETWFRQDYGAASKPERIDRRDGEGQLLRSEIYEYTTNGEKLPWTSLPTGEWEYVYADDGVDCPGAECKRKYTHRTFSEYGELAVAVEYGDYDAEGDEQTLTTTFVPNTTAYIVSRAAEAKTFEGVGTEGSLINETLTYYDGATGWNRAPSAGLPTTEARWLSSPSSFVQTHKVYDRWGNVTAEINAVGARTELTFDAKYHVFETSKTNALGQSTQSTWDVVCGERTETVDLNGERTTMTYDAHCRLAEKVEPGGNFERHSWMDMGDAERQYELVEKPAANGTDEPLWTRKYLDGYRRTWREVNKGPDAATGDIHIDTAFNARFEESAKTRPYYWVSGESQPETYATTTEYDALDRKTRVTHPDGAYTAKTYGLWSVTETDELGHAKTDYHDAEERRIAHEELVEDAVETTQYVYDVRGNLAQSIDPLGNVTTYETDSLGRKTLMVDPDLGRWSYEYDGAGRLIAQTDAKGQRTELAYDALDRKTSKTSLAGTDAAQTVTWIHDEIREGYANIGKLTTTTDSAGSETFDHDVAGNIVKTVRTIDDARYVFEHGFDAGKRKTWTTYPDGGTVGTPSSPLTYDGAGRLASIPGFVVAARYDAEGQLSELRGANGVVTTRSYSPERGWIDRISAIAGDVAIQDVAYTRNAKGMITEVASPFENEGWTYEYDELDRLVVANNASSSELDQTLEYDAIGNITYSSRFGEYAYGTSQPHAVTAAGSNTYAYDAAGSMISGAGRTLAWDGDNRLASIAAPPPEHVGSHDGDEDGDDASDGGGGTGCGTVSGGGSSTWGLLVLVLLACTRRGGTAPRVATRPKRFAPGLAGLALAVACAGGPHGGPSDDAPPGSDAKPEDPLDEQGRMTMTFTYDAEGVRIRQVEGAITRHYVGDDYEIEIGGAASRYIVIGDLLVARTDGTTSYWVHADHLGSIQAETDGSGVEVHRKQYAAYGEISSLDGSLEYEPRGYIAQRHDDSGLLFLHARYYDPALGRFISPDLIIDGPDTVGLNRYAYVGNDPINHKDVTGKDKDMDVAADGSGGGKDYTDERFFGTAEERENGNGTLSGVLGSLSQKLVEKKWDFVLDIGKKTGLAAAKWIPGADVIVAGVSAYNAQNDWARDFSNPDCGTVCRTVGRIGKFTGNFVSTYVDGKALNLIGTAKYEYEIRQWTAQKEANERATPGWETLLGPKPKQVIPVLGQIEE